MDSLEPLQSNESLQELARKLKLDVPDRYIQNHLEPTFVSYDSSPLPSIPVIDMNDLIKNLGSDMDQLENLRYLVNHGVDKLLVENMKKEMVEFFKLPEEEKSRYKLKAGEYEGYGQTILHAQDQKVDWADRFYMITNPLHRRKSHLLPNFPPSI
ncbi:codeine O-demethylase-like protein, partial [Tanacetum coccineum]